MAGMMVIEWKLVEAFSLMVVEATPKGNLAYVASLTVQSELIEQIQQALPEDRIVELWVNEQDQVNTSKFKLRDGIL